MTEKTIKQFVDEVKQSFGAVEFVAENKQTGQRGGSSGWQDHAPARLEISADDYIALGKLNIKSEPPSAGVLSSFLKIVFWKMK